MSQTDTKPTTSKRTGTAIVHATGLTLAERMDLIREGTADSHAARIAEARRAFESALWK
jgi:hypothetical protein